MFLHCNQKRQSSPNDTHKIYFGAYFVHNWRFLRSVFFCHFCFVNFFCAKYLEQIVKTNLKIIYPKWQNFQLLHKKWWILTIFAIFFNFEIQFFLLFLVFYVKKMFQKVRIQQDSPFNFFLHYVKKLNSLIQKIIPGHKNVFEQKPKMT